MPYINIDSATERMMEKYCQATGMTIEKAVKAGLKEWYDTFGEPVVIYSPQVHPLRQARPRTMRTKKKRINTCANVLNIESSDTFRKKRAASEKGIAMSGHVAEVGSV